MMRDLTTSRVPRVRWKPDSLSQHDLETDLRFQAGGHGTVLGHAQLHEPLSLLFRQAGHVEVMHRVDVGEVRGRAAGPLTAQLDAVVVDGEAALADHLHDVVGRAAAYRVQQELHRPHAGLGFLFAVHHHPHAVRGDADETAVNQVVNGCHCRGWGRFVCHDPLSPPPATGAAAQVPGTLD